MKIIDLHCDTISKIFNSKDDINLHENDFCVDIKKLKKGDSLAQFFAMYIYKNLNLNNSAYASLYEYTLAMIDRFFLEIKKNDEEIGLARNSRELRENQKVDKISAFLTIEEGGIIKKDLSKLRNLYRLGVRLVTLTWNFPNSIGYPNCKDKYRGKGLTDFGKEAVKEMNRLGMIIDVSHLSDAGFNDVAAISTKPFIASHSNAREIRNHPRNLTDEMIKTLSSCGGIMGINFSADFLDGSKISRISSIIKHIKHIRDVGGIEIISLGSDFDGISCDLEIQDFSQIGKLIDSLFSEGFTTEEVEKICYRNAIRVIREAMNNEG